MCLELNKNFRKETEEFRDSSKILIGYKELSKRDARLVSPYQSFEYKIGKNISDRKKLDFGYSKFLI